MPSTVAGRAFQKAYPGSTDTTFVGGDNLSPDKQGFHFVSELLTNNEELCRNVGMTYFLIICRSEVLLREQELQLFTRRNIPQSRCLLQNYFFDLTAVQV